jgi:hypothetical protein
MTAGFPPFKSFSLEVQAATIFLTLVSGVLGLPLPTLSLAALGREKAVSGVRGRGAVPDGGVLGSLGGGGGPEVDDFNGELGRELTPPVLVGDAGLEWLLTIEGAADARVKVEVSAPRARGLEGKRGVERDWENGPEIVERTCPSDERDDPDAEVEETEAPLVSDRSSNSAIKFAARRPTGEAV